MDMLWFNFILGLNVIFFCFKLIIIHYHTQKQTKKIIKFKPRIKLSDNRYIYCPHFGRLYPLCKRNNYVYIGKFSNNNPDGQNFHILAILILKYPPYSELTKQILYYELMLLTHNPLDKASD